MGEIEVDDFSEWKVQPTSKMAGYGLGYIIINYLLLYGLAQIDFFYRNVMGLDPGLILAAGLILGFWAMINDPVIGYLTDRPFKWTRKRGLRKPWIMIATVPIFIFFILIFTAPLGAEQMTIFLYLIIVTCIFDVFFSLYNDHLYGGYTNQFLTKFERRKSFMLIVVMGFIILIGMVVLQSAIVGIIGELKQESYIINAIAMVIMMGIFSIFVFKSISESEEMKTMFVEKYNSAEKTSFVKVAKTALGTKNFRVSLLGYTLQVTSITLWNAAQLYFFVDVYGLNYELSTIPLVLSIIGAIGSIPFWSNFTRRGTFKRTYWVAFLLHGLSFIPFTFLILVTSSMMSLIMHSVFLFISNIFYAGELTMLQPVASDTYDEVALKLGKRNDAAFVGIRNFFFRIAFLIQYFVFWLVLVVITDYIPHEFGTEAIDVVQPLQAKFGILVMGALLPAILLIIMSQIFRKYYTLEGKEKDELVKGLKEAGLFIA